VQSSISSAHVQGAVLAGVVEVCFAGLTSCLRQAVAHQEPPPKPRPEAACTTVLMEAHILQAGEGYGGSIGEHWRRCQRQPALNSQGRACGYLQPPVCLTTQQPTPTHLLSLFLMYLQIINAGRSAATASTPQLVTIFDPPLSHLLVILVSNLAHLYTAATSMDSAVIGRATRHSACA
jgi:hypothetical protein